jgi:hypothetical protein
MEPDQTPPRPSQPTDAELSRIAREAVRQPADPRLDKQLERMGLTDAPAPTAPPAAGPVADPTVEALEERLRRVESIVWVVVAAVGILAAAVVVLLLR